MRCVSSIQIETGKRTNEISLSVIRSDYEASLEGCHYRLSGSIYSKHRRKSLCGELSLLFFGSLQVGTIQNIEKRRFLTGSDYMYDEGKADP